ncbi:hypothetical protein [Ekhidna sp.]|jgi:peptidoglycan L-alanyl-D-glutamate endopeptidase CwlK|uniref:hypothetical protein n=1 Tax=Ekhidna sp. TaxID=2608089 RepID=UPI0032EF93A2
MSYQFGNTSLERLETCDQDLIYIMDYAIRYSPIDFGIAEGHRSKERQKELFDEGKSRIDGVTKMGKHNFNPSLAADIYAWVNGKASWDRDHLNVIAGVIIAVSEMLFDDGVTTHRLRWGGNWDGDGEVISDQSFMDLPHFELIEA